MGRYLSGQRGQIVALVVNPMKVRIRSLPTMEVKYRKSLVKRFRYLKTHPEHDVKLLFILD